MQPEQQSDRPVDYLDNQAHVIPPAGDYDLVTHVTDGGYCPCLPSVHEVRSDDRERPVGFVVRHHRNGIAASFDRSALPAGLARLLS